jgi:hypothetical protein
LELSWLSCPNATSLAQPFHFPTANRELLNEGGEARFFVGTVGKPWTSGMFGCVRTDGRQFHEGIDIRCLQRNRQGEPTDPILATADGTVVYVNPQPGLSNYGRYIVIQHFIEGLEIYSLYAHLREIAPGIEPGKKVQAGVPIAVMGRSTNTRQGISKERAHVHFELNLLVNERFEAWRLKNMPDQRNDHGQWNGHNLFGIDPRLVFLAQAQEKGQFQLLKFLRQQNELCRVVVRDTSFPWLHRYISLIRRNPIADREGVAGYEIALNYSGLPFQLVPRASREIAGPARIQLLSVNEAEQANHSCGRLLAKRGGRWELTASAVRWLDLLIF